MHKKKTIKSEAICSCNQNIRKKEEKIRNKIKDNYEAVVILKSNAILDHKNTQKISRRIKIFLFRIQIQFKA